MYERIIDLIGEKHFNKIQNTKILLIGVGGVGGFVFEGLIRSGFLNITIIDKDKIELSNLNRQIITSNNNINESKVDIAKKRALNINKNIKINAIEMNLNKNNINELEKDFDFIVDACDDINTKLELIKFASINNIKIISSMGMGNRVDASNIKVSTLDKTNNDPLSKKLRKLVKDNNIKMKIPVVYDSSLPYKKGKVSSMITSPGIAGLLIVNYIINNIINP